MPSNDERREVAARLRNGSLVFYTRRECAKTHLQNCAWCGDLDCCDNTTACSLADLIEPEPERARRPRLHGNEFGFHDIHCGECYSLMLIQRDGSETWPNYCSECGTRVKEGV